MQDHPGAAGTSVAMSFRLAIASSGPGYLGRPTSWVPSSPVIVTVTWRLAPSMLTSQSNVAPFCTFGFLPLLP
jgi:hypothetical protein